MKVRCLNPQTVWRCGVKHCKSDGVLSPNLVFSPKEAEDYFRSIYGDGYFVFMSRAEQSLPCGKCLACTIRKRKDWTTRLTHESMMYEGRCCFITLTYDDDHIPSTDFLSNEDEKKQFDRGLDNLPLATLLVADVQKFLKRLRRYLEYVPKRSDGRDHVTDKIRYYAVGEYGGKFGRPHYHLMIFGWVPSDMKVWKSKDGHILYRSAQVEKLWRFGFSVVEPVVGGVAKYCSRYVTKKFAKIDGETYFDQCVVPEFVLQSTRNGGIGSTWFDEYWTTCMRRGICYLRTGGNFYKAAIPRYYYDRLRKKNLPLWLELREERITFCRTRTRGSSEDDYNDLLRSCENYVYKERMLLDNEVF